jgi:hypothetical protein
VAAAELRPHRALAAARRLTRTARVGVIHVRDGDHAMLRRHRTFDHLAAAFTAATLLGRPATDPHGPLGRILEGESCTIA